MALFDEVIKKLSKERSIKSPNSPSINTLQKQLTLEVIKKIASIDSDYLISKLQHAIYKVASMPPNTYFEVSATEVKIILKDLNKEKKDDKS